MALEKLGLVKMPVQKTPWWQTHAYTPTPVQLSEEIIRIFVACLDKNQVGRIGYVDVSAADPTRVFAVSDAPALDVGEPGAFDDNGVTPVSIVRLGDELRLYYIGWQLSDQVRYMLFVGVATSHDNGRTFQRLKKVPVLDCSDSELIVRTAANVMHDGDIWRMWYIAGSKTILHEDKQVPTYAMRYLESDDGISWGDYGALVMEPDGEDEFGYGRPFVLKKPAGDFEMWYSIRSKSRRYHIGYATSDDGVTWKRQDDLATIAATTNGWDSEMMAFGAIADIAQRRYLFYNGNNYGEDGFGVAVWHDDDVS
ncbi:MAG: glucosyl hydrolase [Alphaproteobacteria bacterium]|nr:glucosyl hydrolase [Alphaproteobacteria bacterium]